MARSAGVQVGERERGFRDEVSARAGGDVRTTAVAVVVVQTSIGGRYTVEIGAPVDTRGSRGEFQQQVPTIIDKRSVKVEGYRTAVINLRRAGIRCRNIIGGVVVRVVELIFVDYFEFSFKDTGPRSGGQCFQIEGDG